MKQELFESLLDKYMLGELTPEDKILLAEMIREPQYEQVLDRFAREIMLSDEFTGLESPRIKAGILENLEVRMKLLEDQRMTGQRMPLRRGRIVPVMRYAAAAMIGLLMLGGGYLLWHHYSDNRRMAKLGQVAHAVIPGHNGAILTLSNGSQIVLDSIHKGIVTEEGKAKIVKGEGGLAYQDGAVENQILYNTLSTPRGRQYQLTLADGTRVWLNAGSSIRFPTSFPGNVREVSITGEVYLEVAQNAGKPFTITTGGMKVEVLGTSLDINAYPDEENHKATLLEGKIRVSGNVKGGEKEDVSGEGSGIILKPGQQAQLSKGDELKIIDNVDPGEVLAWKNGFFQFNGASIQTIMHELSRWYDVEVVYDGVIPKHSFVGRMGRDYNLSEVLTVLGTSGDVHFRIEGRRIIVRP
jgi:transmembrane sensor